jgi:hypothetical protein
MLEKFLTMQPENFSPLLRDSPNPAELDTDSRREAYRYAKAGLPCSILISNLKLIMIPQSKRFVMRSQLDCYDSRLPGTGVFDLKTRAALPVRLDTLNFEVIHLLL